MPIAELRGVFPIIATPFTSSEKLDEDSLRNLIRILPSNGSHGLTLFGIAGEYYKLSESEAQRMAEIAIEECGRLGVPVIVSVTQHATALAVEQAKRWAEAGADALMLLPPFFLKPAASEISYHVQQVARAVPIPIILQYAPEQTGVPISPEILAQLTCEVPNLFYHKIECRPPGPYITRLLSLAQTELKVFIGNAGFHLIEGLDRGATGVMPGCSMCDVYRRVYDLHGSGKRSAALDLHISLVGMLNHIRQDVEMIIAFEKRILQRRGWIAEAVCRRPAYRPDAVAMHLFDELYERVAALFRSDMESARDAPIKSDHLASQKG